MQARRARLAAPVFSDQDLAEMRERNPDEAWLWTREARDSLRRAEEDIEAGRITRFSSGEDFLRSLAGRDADADV